MIVSALCADAGGDFAPIKDDPNGAPIAEGREQNKLVGQTENQPSILIGILL